MSKDGQLSGVWIGLLHLQNLGELAKEFGDGQQFVYADQHGHEVVYSNKLSLSLEDSDRPLAEMEVYKKAIAGQSGWSKESIGGKEMFVAYQPVQAPSTTWAVFSIQPCDSLMKPVQDFRTTLYSVIAVVSAIAAGMGIAIAKKAG